MGGEVRYCTTEDGVRIAYCVEGEGPPLIVLPVLLASFSQDHVVPRLADAIHRISQGHRLIRFDTRGSGLSQRDVVDMSLIALRRDVEAVVSALRLKRFSMWGHSIGAIRALDFAANHPRSVARLVLFMPFSRLLDVFPREMLEALKLLAHANWTVAAQTVADLTLRKGPSEGGLQFAEAYRQATTADIFARLIDANIDVDLTSDLSKVDSPTLILCGFDDPVFSVALGQKVTAAMPNAQLLAVPDLGSNALFDERAADAANAFLTEGLQTSSAPAGKAAQGPFRTVLLTDIVGHTEMMRRLGDQRGREVLRDHERITREVLKAHDGAEVKTMGDGFMASFASVTRAVECAIALQRAFAERNESAAEPLSIRVGLNAGEPIEEEGDLFGATVILAARIAAQADGGEVLASMAVRELCAGKGRLFSDRGEHVLRGFEDPVRMFEISWRTTG